MVGFLSKHRVLMSALAATALVATAIGPAQAREAGQTGTCRRCARLSRCLCRPLGAIARSGAA